VLSWGCLGDLFESDGGLLKLPVKHFGVVIIWWVHEHLMKRSGTISSTWATQVMLSV
jgi:hypothetical protein